MRSGLIWHVITLRHDTQAAQAMLLCADYISYEAATRAYEAQLRRFARAGMVITREPLRAFATEIDATAPEGVGAIVEVRIEADGALMGPC